MPTSTSPQRDREKQCVFSFPDLPKEYPNAKGTVIRTAVWNQGKRLMTSATRHLVNKNQIDILAVPEFKYDERRTPTEANICYKQGIRLFYTKHTAIYCRLQTIAPTIQEHRTVHDGRAQFLVCKLAETYHIFIIAYGYQTGIDPNYHVGPYTLEREVSDMRYELLRKYKHAEWHILGDLQTTVDDDEGYRARNHRIGAKQPRRAHNLYDFGRRVLGCKSAFPALHPNDQYITRVGAPSDKDGKKLKDTGGGIDHIMHPKHYFDLNRILLAKVDDLECKNYAWTDHHLLYADFDAGTYLAPYPDTPYTKYLFRTITGLPVKFNEDENVQWYELRESAADTPGARKQKKLWDNIQKAATSDFIQDKLKRMIHLLEEAEANLSDVASHLETNSDASPDQLPQRTPLQKTNINLAYNLFIQICEDICTATNLSYETSLNAEIQKAIDAHEKTYSGPLGADDTSYRPFTSLINQVKSAHGCIEQAHHIFGAHAEAWPTAKKRNALSDHMLALRASFTNMLEAAEAYDSERATQKQADNDAQMEKDLNPTKRKGKQKVSTTPTPTQHLKDAHTATMTAVQHELKDMYDIDTTSGLPINSLKKHFDKLLAIQEDVEALPWPPDSNPEQWEALCTDKTYENSVRLIKNKIKNERNSILNSRGNQNSATTIRNLDTKNFKEVLHHYKSAKKKAGTTQLHSARKILDQDGRQRLKIANTPAARIEATRKTLEKQLNAPPGDHFFINTTSDDIGVNGCEYNRSTFTRNDIPRWCPQLTPLLTNTSAEDAELINQVITDHSKLQHMFTQPSSFRPEFTWPYKYDTTQSKFTAEEETRRLLSKMIKGSPGKARHDGLTLHILSRLPKDFYEAYVHLENLILTCRIQPDAAGDQTIALLGKPGNDPHDRRPISLSTDTAAHWSSRIQRHYSEAILASGLLPPEIKAYTKNISVEETTLEHACAIEDSLQYGTYLAEISDDMEKMYNMISNKYQLHLNLQATGTNYGYGEWIAEDQKESTVYVRSPEAQIITKFSYGLRQGKGFSCPLAILVAWELLYVWSLDLPNDEPGLHPYQMGAKDPQTGRFPTLKAISYVDDNARYTTGTSCPQVCQRVQGYIDHASSWYNVNRIGRKSPKCRIRLYGLNPAEHDQIPKFTSIAWSYLHDRPIKSEIQTTVQTSHIDHSCPVDLADTPPKADPTTGPDDLPADQLYAALFGTNINMQGLTNTAKNTSAMKNSIDRIHGTKINKRLATLAHNTLVTSLGEFNPLHKSEPAATVSRKIDGLTGDSHRSFGLSVNDPRHIIFLPPTLSGHGVRHAGGADLASRARELEIHPNSDTHLGSMIRSRLAALRDDNTSANFLRRNIIELAKYGYFFRDVHQSFHTDLLEYLTLQDDNYTPPLGSPGHSQPATENKRMDVCLGEGNRHIAHTYSYGSDLCNLLEPHTRPSTDPSTYSCLFSETYWSDPPLQDALADILPALTPTVMAKACWYTAEARAARFRDSHTIQEWRWTSDLPLTNDFSTSPSNQWKQLTPQLHHSIPHSPNRPIPPGPFDPQEASDRFIASIRLDPSNPEDALIFEKIAEYKSPPFLAIDAGTYKEGDAEIIVATASLCVADLRDHNISDITTYENENVTVLRSLVQTVPCQIGTDNSTNNTGELCAFLLKDAMLPPNMPHVTVADSMGVRAPLLAIREAARPMATRPLLRKCLPQLGKAQMSRAIAIIHRQKSANPHLYPDARDTVSAFIKASSKSWPTKKPYRRDQFDTNEIFPYLHCKSHQLTPTGNLKTKNDEKVPASPGYLLTILNHHADRPCTITLKNFRSTSILTGDARDIIGPRQQPLSTLYYTSPTTRHGKATYEQAVADLLLHAPHKLNRSAPTNTIDQRPFDNIPLQTYRFGITRDTNVIDKSVSARLKRDITSELSIRLSHRAHQGWFARNEHLLTNKYTTNPMLTLAYNHRSSVHTRTIHINPKYSAASKALLPPPPPKPTKKRTKRKRTNAHASTPSSDTLLKQCPFCITPPNTPIFPGNARHAHCLCTNDTVCKVRNLSNAAINATLAKFHLIRKHSPYPTSSIIDAIGAALTAADAPSDNTYVITSSKQLRTEIQRLHRLNKYVPPPQHPYQYALRHLPHLVRAGLLPVSPQNTQGTTDPTTSHLYLGLLPASLNNDLSHARKAFILQARNNNPTTWLDKHYHELCNQEPSLAALFPESEITDDEGNKILVRRTTTSTLLYLQRELYFGLQQRAIRLYQITTALVKSRQHRICRPQPDTEEPLLTPTRQPSTNQTKKDRPRKEQVRQRATKTPDPNRQFPCPNYLCVIRRTTNPDGGGRAKKDNGEFCEQCKQHQKSLSLCTKLEAIVQRNLQIQTILASSATWKKETITTTLLENEDVLRTVQETNTSRQIKSTAQLAKCPITTSAFQLLANTILRRPDTESRFYDKPPNENDLASLYPLIHLDTCACEHEDPPPKCPSICPDCNLSRRHNVPTTNCTLCTKPLSTDRTHDPDTLSTSPHNKVCATCTIPLLCRFNSAGGRSQRIQHAATNTSHHAPTERPPTARPGPTKTDKPQHRPPHPAPPPQPPIHAPPGGIPRIPTAAELFPLNSSLESAIRLDIMQSSANQDTFLNTLRLRGSNKDKYKPIRGIRLRDIVRLQPATSTDQWLNDEIINSALTLFWTKSHNKHDPSRIGFIRSNKIDLMERRPTSTTAKRAIYRKPKKDSPWLAHAATDIILYPYRAGGSAHWSLGVHDTRKKTAQYYEGFNVGTNRDTFLELMRKTVYRHAPSMTFVSTMGPRQSNDFDCGITLLLVAYVWYFHPDPNSLNWKHFMQVRNIIPHFRRVLIIALCTGDIQNIFASSGPSGLPFTTNVATQTLLPFQPSARPLVAATDKAPTSPSRGNPDDAISLLDSTDDDDSSTQSCPTDNQSDQGSTTTDHNNTSPPTLQRHRDLPLVSKKYILQAHRSRRRPITVSTARGTSTRILALLQDHIPTPPPATTHRPSLTQHPPAQPTSSTKRKKKKQRRERAHKKRKTTQPSA